MALQDFEQWSQPILSPTFRLCSHLPGLTAGQRRLCRRHKDHMAPVSRGLKVGIEECQYQFRERRWNCTVVEDETVFGPLTLIGKFTYIPKYSFSYTEKLLNLLLKVIPVNLLRNFSKHVSVSNSKFTLCTILRHKNHPH